MCKPEINFIKSKKEPVKCSIPKKFLICPLAMMMAIPEVKPVITGEGISEIKFPKRKIPASNRKIPAIKVAINIPFIPYLPMSEIKIAAICSDPQNIDFSNLYFGGLFLWSNIP